MQLHRGTVASCPAELYRALRQVWNDKNTPDEPDKPWTFKNEDAGPDPYPMTSPYDDAPVEQ